MFLYVQMVKTLNSKILQIYHYSSLECVEDIYENVNFKFKFKISKSISSLFSILMCVMLLMGCRLLYTKHILM